MLANEMVQTRVERLFADRLSLPVPAPDADLLNSGLLDSLAFVDLWTHLEREFGVTIDLLSLEVEDFRSLAAITAVVQQRLHGASGQSLQP